MKIIKALDKLEELKIKLKEKNLQNKEEYYNLIKKINSSLEDYGYEIKVDESGI